MWRIMNSDNFNQFSITCDLIFFVMKTKLRLFLLAACAITLFACNTSQKIDVESLMSELDMDASLNKLTDSEEKSGWNLLFDGKSLDGWHGFNQDIAPDCWRAEDDALKIINEGGAESAEGILTDKKYMSFALSLEFQVTEGANSGVIYHVAEDPKYTYAYETGTEFQVIDHANWPDPLEGWQICGANYAMHAPSEDVVKPLGEWNSMLLVVDGNSVTHVLNGKVIVEFEKYSDEWTALRNSGKWSDYPDYGKFDEGFITLQNHGTKVFFRNIKIKEF